MQHEVEKHLYAAEVLGQVAQTFPKSLDWEDTSLAVLAIRTFLLAAVEGEIQQAKDVLERLEYVAGGEPANATS